MWPQGTAQGWAASLGRGAGFAVRLGPVHELQPYSGRYIWAFPDNPGQPEWGPHLLPDGTKVWDLVANGDTGRLPFTPRFRRRGGGPQIGDLLWTGTATMKVASRRFVDVLQSVHASGYRTFEIDLVGGRKRPMPGFVGFAVDLEALLKLTSGRPTPGSPSAFSSPTR